MLHAFRLPQWQDAQITDITELKTLKSNSKMVSSWIVQDLHCWPHAGYVDISTLPGFTPPEWYKKGQEPFRKVSRKRETQPHAWRP